MLLKDKFCFLWLARMFLEQHIWHNLKTSTLICKTKPSVLGVLSCRLFFASYCDLWNAQHFLLCLYYLVCWGNHFLAKFWQWSKFGSPRTMVIVLIPYKIVLRPLHISFHTFQLIKVIWVNYELHYLLS